MVEKLIPPWLDHQRVSRSIRLPLPRLLQKMHVLQIPGKKPSPSRSPSPQKNPESDQENQATDHGNHPPEDDTLGQKIDIMLKKIRGDILAELQDPQKQGTFSDPRTTGNRGRKRKSRSRSPILTDDDLTDSASQDISPVRTPASYKKKKQASARKKGSSSLIPIVSASEDEDWGRSRSKFGYLIGHNVSEKIRVKIQSDCFVEMADLLPSAEDNKDGLVMKKSDEGIRFVESKSRKFIDIEKWNQAFGVYMSVYVETAASLSEAVLLMKQLLTYQRDINLFARRRESGFLYDKHFRKERENASKPDLFSDIRHDIRLDLDMVSRKDRGPVDQQRNFRQNRRAFRGFERPSGPGSAFNRPKSPGFCFLFNDENKHCNRFKCHFKHSCMQCGGGHPKFMCERANAAAANLERLQASAQPPRQSASNPSSRQPVIRQGGLRTTN